MNTNTATRKSGATFTKVVFLMAQNPTNDRWEPMAYFPDIPWGYNDNGNKMSYMHNGQHGPCCEAFALLDCIAPKRQHFAAVSRLKKELESLPQPSVLTVLDSAEWLKSKGERRKELDRNVYEATAVVDSQAMFDANKSNGENRRSRNAA